MGLFNNKKNKKVYLYAVVKKDNSKNFLTLTLSKDEAIEYIKNLLKILNFSHFNSWCLLKEVDVNDDKSWTEYLAVCASEQLEEYSIVKVSYLFKDIVAMIRMFGHCIPIGCSFDTAIEKLYLADQISSGTMAKIIDDLTCGDGTSSETTDSNDNTAKDDECGEED